MLYACALCITLDHKNAIRVKDHHVAALHAVTHQITSQQQPHSSHICNKVGLHNIQLYNYTDVC